MVFLSSRQDRFKLKAEVFGWETGINSWVIGGHTEAEQVWAYRDNRTVFLTSFYRIEGQARHNHKAEFEGRFDPWIKKITIKRAFEMLEEYGERIEE